MATIYETHAMIMNITQMEGIDHNPTWTCDATVSILKPPDMDSIDMPDDPLALIRIYFGLDHFDYSWGTHCLLFGLEMTGREFHRERSWKMFVQKGATDFWKHQRPFLLRKYPWDPTTTPITYKGTARLQMVSIEETANDENMVGFFANRGTGGGSMQDQDSGPFLIRDLPNFGEGLNSFRMRVGVIVRHGTDPDNVSFADNVCFHLCSTVPDYYPMSYTSLIPWGPTFNPQEDNGFFKDHVAPYSYGDGAGNTILVNQSDREFNILFATNRELEGGPWLGNNHEFNLPSS